VQNLEIAPKVGGVREGSSPGRDALVEMDELTRERRLERRRPDD
jgi:hypothetical protein